MVSQRARGQGYRGLSWPSRGLRIRRGLHEAAIGAEDVDMPRVQMDGQRLTGIEIPDPMDKPDPAAPVVVERRSFVSIGIASYSTWANLILLQTRGAIRPVSPATSRTLIYPSGESGTGRGGNTHRRDYVWDSCPRSNVHLTRMCRWTRTATRLASELRRENRLLAGLQGSFTLRRSR